MPLMDEQKQSVYDRVRQKLSQDYTDERRAELEDEVKRENRKPGMIVGQALAGIGQSLQSQGGGRSGGIDFSYFDKIKDQRREDVLGGFDRRKKSLFDDANQESLINENIYQEQRKDPNSEVSKNFVSNLAAVNPKIAERLEGLSVEQAEKLMPTIASEIENSLRRDFENKKFKYEKEKDQEARRAAIEEQIRKEAAEAEAEEINQKKRKNFNQNLANSFARVMDVKTRSKSPGGLGLLATPEAFSEDKRTWGTEIAEIKRNLDTAAKFAPSRFTKDEVRSLTPTVSDSPKEIQDKMERAVKLMSQVDVSGLSDDYADVVVDDETSLIRSEKPKLNARDYVTVSNGTETLSIPSDDLADAMEDGFSLVGSNEGNNRGVFNRNLSRR